MPTDPIRLAVIIGSVRDGRFGPNVANWFVEQAEQRGDLTLDVIDLADTTIPDPAFTDRIGAADAFVVITPEYNHSFPGPLKHAIDSVRGEWSAKPVGFVSYGGMAGGLRAVEPLRGVFAELHAVTIRETVSFTNYPDLFDGTGQLKDPTGPNIAAATLLRQLVWWALALNTARRLQPYPS
jgi:NAD(P)H-dependent FMN reductase